MIGNFLGFKIPKPHVPPRTEPTNPIDYDADKTDFQFKFKNKRIYKLIKHVKTTDAVLPEKPEVTVRVAGETVTVDPLDWTDQGTVFDTLIEVYKESVEDSNEDKAYFLLKLEQLKSGDRDITAFLEGEEKDENGVWHAKPLKDLQDYWYQLERHLGNFGDDVEDTLLDIQINSDGNPHDWKSWLETKDVNDQDTDEAYAGVETYHGTSQSSIDTSSDVDVGSISVQGVPVVSGNWSDDWHMICDCGLAECPNSADAHYVSSHWENTGAHSWYRKNHDGLVIVEINAKYVGPSDPSQSGKIVTLPEGYRPPRLVIGNDLSNSYGIKMSYTGEISLQIVPSTFYGYSVFGSLIFQEATQTTEQLNGFEGSHYSPVDGGTIS